MNEILLLVLAIAGVFSIACSIALISLGKIIDRFPLGDELKRTRSLSSPIESTQIAVAIYWALFVIGCYALLQESRIALILGITTLFSGVLFMFTALILSFAVLSAMRRRKNLMEIPLFHMSPEAPVTVSAQPDVVERAPKKYYRRPVSNFMIDAMTRRD
jgi:hypothetical protein